MLTFTALRRKLNVPRKTLSAWLAEGMPCEGPPRRRRFEPRAVHAWLVETGKAVADPAAAKPTPATLSTRAEVARHFGVSDRTVATWLTDPAFPGQAGRPGRRDGHFPIDQIAEWLGDKRAAGAGDDGESHRARLTKARADRATLELDQLLNRLIDCEAVERTIARQIHTAKAVLSQLPEQVVLALPGDTPAADRQRIRAVCEKMLSDAYAALAAMSEDDDAEPPQAEPTPSCDAQQDA